MKNSEQKRGGGAKCERTEPATISDAKMKTLENDSTEGLLNFLNTASSSVKSVLARPSCFKRNTNHRRFIQKQLKVSKQRSESPSSTVKLIPKQQFPLNKARQRTAPRKRTEIAKREVNSTNRNSTVQRCELEYQSNEQSIFNMRIGDHSDVNREMHYFDECKKFSEMVDDLVDNLLDSSSSSSQDENYQKMARTEVPIHSYCRSGSVSSYSSSSEEDINPEFLSGEELLRCLDISELFVPEGLSGALQQQEKSPEEASETHHELQIVPGNESPVPEHLMYEADITDTQSMPVFENVFQQFSL